MTKIIAKGIPHAISASDVSDPVLQKKVVLLQENMRFLENMLLEAQKAIVELQRR